MNAIEINNQYMENQQIGNNAMAINTELLNIFETIQSDMIADQQ